MALLIGPLVALLGVFAVFVVIRGRAHTRKSVYSTLRSDRELRIRAARQRALAPEADSRPSLPAELPSAPSTRTPAPAVAARPAWDVSPTSPAPAPQFAAQAPVAPPQADPQTPAAGPVNPAGAPAAVPGPAADPATEPQPIPTGAGAKGWNAVPQERKRHLHGRAAEEDAVVGESRAHQLLSYAGLVAALAAFLLGVVLMVASSR